MRTNFTPLYCLESILSTSLGPKGLDKVIVDNETNVTIITNDGATILKHLPIVNPIAMTMKRLAQAIDEKVGDGTTSGVLLACRLVSQADQLINTYKIHPVDVITGYKIALEQCKKKLETISIHINQENQREFLTQIVSTSLNSKILSNYSHLFTTLYLQSIDIITDKRSGIVAHENISNVSYVKVLGGSISDSTLIQGSMVKGRFALPKMTKSIANPSILLLGFDLGYIDQSSLISSSSSSSFKHLQFNNLSFQQRELIEKERRDMEMNQVNQLLENIKQFKGDTCNGVIIISTKRVSPYCLSILQSHGVNVVMNISEIDLKSTQLTTGAHLLHSLSIETKTNYLSTITSCKEVIENNSEYFIELINKDISNRSCTFLLKGPSNYIIEEVQRSINDALSVTSLAMESPIVIAGGGACEIEMWKHLNEFVVKSRNKQIGSIELNIKLQKVILMFAEALLTIPKLLIQNAGYDPTMLIPKLKQIRNQNSNQDDTNNNSESKSNYSVNLSNGTIQDMIKLGVIECLHAKQSQLDMIINTVSMLIKVDQCLAYQE